MFNLSHLSVIRFSGSDAGAFLHSQLSADVLKLASGDSVFACYCEPKGRVLALMLVYKTEEGFIIVMSSSLVTAITDRLKIYRMRSKVIIEIFEEDTLTGLRSDDAPVLASSREHPIRLPGSDLWLVHGAKKAAPDQQWIAQQEWKVAELGHGISWLHAETSAQFLPQMLGFEELGAINYRKGCYPGQEIVARTHYLGKVKRHPRLINCKFSVTPKLMDKVSLVGDDQAYPAVVADYATAKDGGIYLLVITRLDPELPAGKVEFGGETSDIF